MIQAEQAENWRQRRHLINDGSWPPLYVWGLSIICGGSLQTWPDFYPKPVVHGDPPSPPRLSRFHTMPLASPNKALSVQLSGLFSPAPKNTKSLSYLWSVQFSADQKNEVEPWDFLIFNKQFHHYQQGSWIGFQGWTLVMKSKMLNCSTIQR